MRLILYIIPRKLLVSSGILYLMEIEHKIDYYQFALQIKIFPTSD